MTVDSDAASRLAVLEAALAEAEQGERDVQAQQREAGARLEDLTAQLAARPPDEYECAGSPTRGTEAAKLAAAVEKAKCPVLAAGRRLSAASDRTRQAKRALARFKEENIVELAELLAPEAREVAADIEVALDYLDRGLVRYFQVEARFSHLLNHARGLNATEELSPAVSDRLTQLRRTIREYRGSIPAPLPRSLDPDGQGPHKSRPPMVAGSTPATWNASRPTAARRPKSRKRRSAAPVAR